MVLVDTDTAAVAAGVSRSAFRMWASRRQLRPAKVTRRGRANLRWWDLDQVYAAQDRDTRKRETR